MSFWHFVIQTSPKFMYYFWSFFAGVEFYSFFGTVLMNAPRGFYWYMSAALLVYSIEFLYQWGIHYEEA